MILYGIPTCDTCRKARAALEAAGHAVQVRDVRVEPLSPAETARFLEAFGEKLVNRSSTTWRGLSEAALEKALPDRPPAGIAGLEAASPASREMRSQSATVGQRALPWAAADAVISEGRAIGLSGDQANGPRGTRAVRDAEA